jgi:diguanylate cyclase (GGDEF)-like protein
MNFYWQGGPRLVKRLAAFRGLWSIDRGNSREPLLSNLAASIPGFMPAFQQSLDGHASNLLVSASSWNIGGTPRDITDRKQRQAAIHESLLPGEWLSRLTEMAPGALFTLRRSLGGQLSMPWAADQLVNIAGCWPEDTREDISALAMFIHAADVKAWRQAGTESACTLLPWHSEFRLTHPIRGETWIEWRANPVREPTGSVLWHGVLYDISERKRHEHQLKLAVNHDPLTHLPNRILLSDRMQQAVAQSRRSGKMFAVLSIELDGVKFVNAQYGHDASDRALIEMSRRMTEVLRAGDTVARIGGNEFAIVLSGFSSCVECAFSAQRVLTTITKPVEDGANHFLLGASVGIALYPDDADDAESLLRHAGEAMQTAKRTGHNQFVFYRAGHPTDTSLRPVSALLTHVQ